MDISTFFILLSLLTLSQSQRTPHSINQTDLQVAISDMRSRSYFGFTILLQMLNSTSTLISRDVTFFMPGDAKISDSSISAKNLESFLLSHSIPEALLYRDLAHFPTGTIVPSGLSGRRITMINHGRASFFVNNARIMTPNVCLNSSNIRCHGIDAVLKYGKELQDEVHVGAALPTSPTIAPVPENIFDGINEPSN